MSASSLATMRKYDEILHGSESNGSKQGAALKDQAVLQRSKQRSRECWRRNSEGQDRALQWRSPGEGPISELAAQLRGAPKQGLDGAVVRSLHDAEGVNVCKQALTACAEELTVRAQELTIREVKVGQRKFYRVAPRSTQERRKGFGRDEVVLPLQFVEYQTLYAYDLDMYAQELRVREVNVHQRKPYRKQAIRKTSKEFTSMSGLGDAAQCAQELTVREVNAGQCEFYYTVSKQCKRQR
jgi:hypothetical protein